MADGGATTKRKRAVTFGPDGALSGDAHQREASRRRPARADLDEDDEVVVEEHRPQAASGEDTDEDDDDDEGEVERLDAAGDVAAVLPSAASAAAEKKKAKLKRALGEKKTERMAEEFNDAGDAFEPFNLRREREDGHFDASGEFVWKKKSADDYDAWIDSIDSLDPRARSEMQRAAAGASRIRNPGTGEGAGDDDEDDDDVDEDDVEEEADAVPADAGARKAASLSAILGLLQPKGETVAAALRRLSGHGGSGGPKPKGGRVPPPSARAAAAASLPGRDMAAFDHLTEAADYLCGAGGLADVYSMDARKIAWELDDAGGAKSDSGSGVERAQASSLPSSAALAPKAALEPSRVATTSAAAPITASVPSTALWMYKLSSDDPTAATFGPFPAAQMEAWRTLGFFAAQKVWVAKAPPPLQGQGGGGSAAVGDDDCDIFEGAGTYLPAAPTAPQWTNVSDMHQF